MVISKGSLIEREACCFTMAVDRYEAQHMECILYAGNEEQGIACCSYIEVAQQIELGLGEMNYPTPSVRIRTFTGQGIAETGAAQTKDRIISARRRGRIATFSIRVKQCLHATWQGKITRDGHESPVMAFESFLELIYLMDKMLTDTATADHQTTDRSSAGAVHEPLTARLHCALSLFGMHSGIWSEKPESSDILICERRWDNADKETFAIRPLFLENHTFQGVLIWSDGRQQRNFRSFLELLSLMLSAGSKHQ